jgi:histidyl-tRNA synthetase
MQFDADTVGSASPAADAEICMMAADTMEALGVPRGSYVVKVNNRKVLDGLLESIGVGGEANAGRRLTVLRAIDKLDRLGPDAVFLLLTTGRKDESGDFAKGAELSSAQADNVLRFLGFSSKVLEAARSVYVKDQFQHPDSHDNASWIAWFSDRVQLGPTGEQGVKELTEIEGLVLAGGYADRVVIDPSVVRGLEYYTGPVYEVELLLDTKDEKGRPVRFGSVGGGGRYDGLVSRFRGEPVPATGFSIGVSRLQAALTLLGKLDVSQAFGPVIVTVFDKARLADYQTMVTTLRNAKIRAELFLGNPKNMGAQFKYADKRNSPCVVIQGGDEKAKGEVQIKDLIEGAKAAAAIASNQEWRESRPAQFAVPEGKMVDAVREVLVRHGVRWE